jgi:hypothetical protein
VHQVDGGRLDREHPGRVPQQRRRGPGVPHAEPGQRQPVRRGHGPARPPGVQQHVGQRDPGQGKVAVCTARQGAGEVGEPVQAFGEHPVRVVLFAEQPPAQQDRGRGGGVVGLAAPPFVPGGSDGLGGRDVAWQRVGGHRRWFPVGDGQQVEGDPFEALDDGPAPAAERVPAVRVPAAGEQTDAHERLSAGEATTAAVSRRTQRHSGKK